MAGGSDRITHVMEAVEETDQVEGAVVAIGVGRLEGRPVPDPRFFGPRPHRREAAPAATSLTGLEPGAVIGDDPDLTLEAAQRHVGEVGKVDSVTVAATEVETRDAPEDCASLLRKGILCSGDAIGTLRTLALATLYGIFAVVYSLRFGHDVFFGPPPVGLPRVPEEPPHWMRVPIELLVLACLVVGIVPAWAIGPALHAAARPVVGGVLPEFSLAVWHALRWIWSRPSCRH